MQKAALPDLFKPALEERVRQGEITMSKTRVTALAGPLMVLVGAIWLLEMAGSLLLRILQVGEERFWDLFLTAWTAAFVLSFFLLLFALMGIRLRFHSSAGIPGRMGLALSVLGAAGVIVSMLARLVLDMAAPVPQAGAVPSPGQAARLRPRSGT